MERRVAYVESITWSTNKCKIRIPNIDGLSVADYSDPDLISLLQGRSKTADLEDADIPYHLQGLRVNDVVYVLESEDANDSPVIVGFYGGTY